MTLDELIAALENATEGSRELDDEIHSALGFDYETHCPLYTKSVDCRADASAEGLGWRGILA